MEIINNDEFKSEIKPRKIQKDKFLKEDLERYYIGEKKSMTEISKIYGCSITTIGNKLSKYGIPIRPHGSFLIDDDGETLNSKYIKGEISSIEYNNKLVRSKGYENLNEYKNVLAKSKGYENLSEYKNAVAKSKGYENLSDYDRKMRYKRGDGLSMSENKKCSKYLGVHICENKEFLSKIINIVESMPENNPGYDVICTKDKKIDVKCGCLSGNNTWNFNIGKNKIADYFLMISFNNRDSLNVQYIWLVKGDAVIENANHYLSDEFVINERDIVHISKGDRSLKRWIKYEITDTYKLEEAQKLCDIFKNIE